MKQIGIVGWKTGDNSFGATVPYLEYLDNFGRTRIIGPKDTVEDHLDLDLLVLPGGPDVRPSSYGEDPGYFTSNHDVMKQHFFDSKLNSFIEKGIPVFGICLGFQMLNVKFGGKLFQNLSSHSYSERYKENHTVEIVNIVNETPNNYNNFLDMYSQITGNKKALFNKIPVNSHHHQAILLRDSYLAKDLVCLAKDDKSEVCEAFIHKDLMIAGVQFHPEEYFVPLANMLIAFLLKNGSKKTRQKEAQVELSTSTSIG